MTFDTNEKDTTLSSNFVAASLTEQIAAAAAETHEDDARYDAEKIAQYIGDLPATTFTTTEQCQVTDILSLSKQTNDQLNDAGLTRADVTKQLADANQNFFIAQRAELKGYLQLTCVCG